MKADVITNHGEAVAADEDSHVPHSGKPSYPHLAQTDKPQVIKQWYSTELRSRTLASIKAEISLAMDSLLEELKTTEDAKVMRSVGFQRGVPT